MNEITPEILESIIKKLVGEINPVGATHIDEEREKNLEVYIGLLNFLIWELYDVADERHDYRASVSNIGQKAYSFLENEYDIFKDTFKDKEESE